MPKKKPIGKVKQKAVADETYLPKPPIVPIKPGVDNGFRAPYQPDQFTSTYPFINYETLPEVVIRSKTKNKYKSLPNVNVSSKTGPSSKQAVESTGIQIYNPYTKETKSTANPGQTKRQIKQSTSNIKRGNLKDSLKDITAVTQFAPMPLVSIPSAIINSGIGASDALDANKKGDILNESINTAGAIPWQYVFPGLVGKGLEAVSSVADLTDNFGLEQNKNGGWLDKYNDGGPVQENYNDNTTSYPPGFVGMGNNTQGRNYSPAWGGQFQKGGYMPSKYQPLPSQPPPLATNPFVQTTNTGSGGGRNKNNWLLGAGLGLGAAGLLYALFNRKRSGGSSDDRCQTGMMWDEENQQCVQDPTYKREIYYSDYGGGSNYTNINAPEQGQGVSPMYDDAIVSGYNSPEANTPSNIMSGGTESSGVPVSSTAAMGASIPGSVGFTYARTNSPAPSEGPYAKKTMPSAQFGKTLKNLEKKVNRYLEGPKSRGVDYSFEAAKKRKAKEIDTLRHAYTAMETSKAIQNKTGNIPILSDALGFIGANALGIGHEVAGLFNPDADLMQVKEGGEDIINNFIGSVAASVPFVSNKNKRKAIQYLSDKGILPDGTTAGRGREYVSGVKYEDGGSMSYYQHGLDWKPRNISRDGSVIKDNMGYWNPDNWGKVVEIDSPNITMKNVEYGPLLGISKQTGERKVMLPGKDYTFANTKQVIEKPLNKKSTGGWLDKYN